jgi:type IV secretion system protein VirB10
MTLQCSTTAAGGATVEWTFAADGSESRYSAGGERRNTVAKWEGAALLINTLVSGPQDYTVMDRWKLSRDRAALTVERHVVSAAGESEAVLAYHREGSIPAVQAPAAPLAARVDPPGFAVRTGTPPPGELTVRSGTHIPLALLGSLDTRHSKEGDKVNLETRFPVSVEGRIAIPRGSFVTGTVARIKTPGRGSSKGELTLTFETLTLPNGVTREIRSWLIGADGTAGKVDREAGKITGERNTGDDARTASGRASNGASAGSLAGAVTGAGSQAGWAVGAVAGLASVLVSRGPDVVLRRGTTLEMVLDRDLRYKPEEVKF